MDTPTVANNPLTPKYLPEQEKSVALPYSFLHFKFKMMIKDYSNCRGRKYKWCTELKDSHDHSKDDNQKREK